MSRKSRSKAAPVLLTPVALVEQASRCVRLDRAYQQAAGGNDPARLEAAGRTFSKAHSVLDAMCTAALQQGADDVLDAALDRAARAEGRQVLMTLVTAIEELCTNFVPDDDGQPVRTLCALPIVMPADRAPSVLTESVLEALELAFVADQPGGTVAVVDRQPVPGAFMESLDYSLVHGLGAAAAARPMAEIRSQSPGLMPDLPPEAFHAGGMQDEAGPALFYALAMVEGPDGFVDADMPQGVPESVRADLARDLGMTDLRLGVPEPIYAALDAGPALLLAAQAEASLVADLAERGLPAREDGRALAVTLHGRHAMAGTERQFLPKELRVSLLDVTGRLLAGATLDAEAADISDFFLDRFRQHLADGLGIRTLHDTQGVVDDQATDRYWTPSGWQVVTG